MALVPAELLDVALEIDHECSNVGSEACISMECDVEHTHLGPAMPLTFSRPKMV